MKKLGLVFALFFMWKPAVFKCYGFPHPVSRTLSQAITASCTQHSCLKLTSEHLTSFGVAELSHPNEVSRAIQEQMSPFLIAAGLPSTNGLIHLFNMGQTFLLFPIIVTGIPMMFYLSGVCLGFFQLALEKGLKKSGYSIANISHSLVPLAKTLHLASEQLRQFRPHFIPYTESEMAISLLAIAAIFQFAVLAYVPFCFLGGANLLMNQPFYHYQPLLGLNFGFAFHL